MTASSDPGALDPVIHAPVRLRVVVTLDGLRPGDSLSFTRLQALLSLTAGNLLTHLRKLEDAGYLTMTKASNRRGAETTVALTTEGRAALAAYRRSLQKLLAPSAVDAEARE